MRRLSTFFFGMVAGGLLIYAALNYHLIQAKDGLHLIPKVDATLAWYDRFAGLAGVRVDEWRRGEAPFPSLRVTEETIIDPACRWQVEPRRFVSKSSNTPLGGFSMVGRATRVIVGGEVKYSW